MCRVRASHRDAATTLRLAAIWITRRFRRGSVAQSVEQRPFKALVPGSSPGRPIDFVAPILHCVRTVISHKHKCIFVEIPKTGSTSVRAILGKAWKPHLNLWQIKNQMETYWTRYGGRKNRILAALYLLRSEKRRKAIGGKQFETYFKFGFVRNPWDRVVSLYERTEALQLKDKMAFDEFVDWIQYSSATCVHSSPHRYQLDWFVDPNGNMLADFIGKFERLEEDWAFVAKKLGLNENLPHQRPNPRARHYTEYYTPRTRDVIANKFKVDIERFGYEFSG